MVGCSYSLPIATMTCRELQGKLSSEAYFSFDGNAPTSLTATQLDQFTIDKISFGSLPEEFSSSEAAALNCHTQSQKFSQFNLLCLFIRIAGGSGLLSETGGGWCVPLSVFEMSKMAKLYML